MFSKSCEYGIRALVFIAQQSLNNQRVRVNDIAKAIDSPTAFTAKILQLLSKENMINSVMGQSGGYEIERTQLEHISLLDVIKVIDGDQIYKGCGLGLAQCNDSNPCPIHFKYKTIRNQLEQMLADTNLLYLATNLDHGKVHLRLNLNK